MVNPAFCNADRVSKSLSVSQQPGLNRPYRDTKTKILGLICNQTPDERTGTRLIIVEISKNQNNLPNPGKPVQALKTLIEGVFSTPTARGYKVLAWATSHRADKCSGHSRIRRPLADVGDING